MAILAAKQLGAERIIAMSRHPDRQKLARSYGATDIVEERGEEGVAKAKELTDGLGAHSVEEAVGTQESFMQAVGATHGGGHWPTWVELRRDHSRYRAVLCRYTYRWRPGAGAPLSAGVDQAHWDRTIDPGNIFDLSLPLEQAAERYKAMDERRATKVLLTL